MITVAALLANERFKFLECHTKKVGLNAAITSVNRIDSVNLKKLIHKNELIITTGVGMTDDVKDCCELIDEIKQQGAAALVINCGPYLSMIPSVLAQYAENQGIILLSMPWRIRIADMTKAIFEQVLQQTGTRTNIEQFIDDLLAQRLHDSDVPLEIVTMLGANVLFDGTIIIVKQTGAVKQEMSLFHDLVRTLFSHKYESYVSCVIGKMVVFIVNRIAQPTALPFSDFAKELYQVFAKKKVTIAIGIGCGYAKIDQLVKSYHEALQVIAIVQHQKKVWLYKYKDLGVYQFLFAHRGSPLLKVFCQETLRTLWEYDRCNNKKYYEFLRVYLEEDGHTNAIANRLYIHRNTVNYRVQRIEKILDRSLANNLDKTSLSLAVLIADISSSNRADD